MDAIHVFTLSAALIFSSLFLRRLFLEMKKKNKNLPPSLPFSLPVIGHLHHLQKYLPLHQSLARISAQHGPNLLLQFGNRRTLVVSSMPLAEECFTTNDATFANRPMLPSVRLNSYDYISLPLGTYGPVWRDMRRIAMIKGLSGHRLDHLSGGRADEVRTLAQQLFRDTASNQDMTKVELRPRLFGLTINVIYRIIAGRRCYGDEDDKGNARLFMEKMEEGFARLGASNAGDFLPGVIGWLARWRSVRKLAEVHHFIDGFVQAVMEERQRKRRDEEISRSNQTMMDALLSMQIDQPKQYTDRYIKALIGSLFAGGSDTPSSAIEWAISLLLNNPEKLEKARIEMDEQVGNNRLLQESDLVKLPYLHCIINETMRMYPVAPLLIPHESMDECTVGGFHVPRGTMLLVNIYAIHRDPKIWSEPTKFLPERFEKGNKEVVKMIPFGMGRRRCPGEGLAMREMGLVLGTLIQCFKWRRVGSEEVDMKEGTGLTLIKAIPIEALCRPRQSMTTLLSQL